MRFVRVTRACICGSDLWPYNQMEPSETGRRMGHEFIGVVDAVGRRRAHREARRPRRRTVRVVRRHLRLLPRGTAHLLPARRLLGRNRARRRPGRGGARPAGRRNARRPAGRRGRRADAVASDSLGRDGHRPPRCARGQGRTGQDSGRRRRRRGRPLRRDCGEAARGGADHPARPSSRPDRARATSSAPPTSSASAAKRRSSACAS